MCIACLFLSSGTAQTEKCSGKGENGMKKAKGKALEMHLTDIKIKDSLDVPCLSKGEYIEERRYAESENDEFLQRFAIQHCGRSFAE
jgi:hypothetical protein